MTSRTEKPWDTQEYWETRFNHHDTPWDLGKVSPTLVSLEEEARLPAQSTIIIPGCGRGHDPLFFSERGYRVSAVDWSKIAVDDLRVIAKRKNFPMEILRTSFWDLPLSWHGTFDACAEHTFFNAIDPTERSRYVEQILKLLKPGGLFLGSIFIIPPEKQPPEGWKSINPSSEGPPFATTERELKQLFEKYFDMEILEPSPTPRTDPVGKYDWWVLFRRKVN